MTGDSEPLGTEQAESTRQTDGWMDAVAARACRLGVTPFSQWTGKRVMDRECSVDELRDRKGNRNRSMNSELCAGTPEGSGHDFHGIPASGVWVCPQPRSDRHTQRQPMSDGHLPVPSGKPKHERFRNLQTPRHPREDKGSRTETCRLCGER